MESATGKKKIYMGRKSPSAYVEGRNRSWKVESEQKAKYGRHWKIMYPKKNVVTTYYCMDDGFRE